MSITGTITRAISRPLLLGIVVPLGLGAATATAQGVPPPSPIPVYEAPPPVWTGRATIYGWLPGIDSNVGTDRGRVDASKSGQDVLDDLDAAFMGTIEARRGPWGVIGDLIYAKLSSEEDTPFGQLFSQAEVDIEMTAFSGYLTYRVAESPTVALDVGAGFRWFDVDVDTTLTEGLLPEQSSSLSDSWANPLVAARGIVRFDDSWFGTAVVDAGGAFDGDSSTWQALITVGYAFNDRWSVQGGYRWMSVDKEIDGQDVDLDLYGPVIGVSARF